MGVLILTTTAAAQGCYDELKWVEQRGTSIYWSATAPVEIHYSPNAQGPYRAIAGMGLVGRFSMIRPGYYFLLCTAHVSEIFSFHPQIIKESTRGEFNKVTYK